MKAEDEKGMDINMGIIQNKKAYAVFLVLSELWVYQL